MENNYERMKMPELKALANMNGLKRYSRSRKADLIESIRTSLREDEPQPIIDETTIKQPQRNETNNKTNTLTKSQLKRSRNKASKIKKKSKTLRTEKDRLKSKKESIEEKIKKQLRAQALDSKKGRFAL